MILHGLGDEVRGARIICVYRKRTKELPVQISPGHRGRRVKILGAPARAIVEKPLKYKPRPR